MGLLATLCIFVAVFGVILIVLGILPYTATYVGRGVPAGIALLIIGIVLYILIALLAHGTPA